MKINEQKPARRNTWTDTELMLSQEDRILLDEIGGYVTAKADIEEVKNDPLFAETNTMVNQMISRDINSKESKTENKDFILRSLDGINDNGPGPEIEEIKRESSKEGLDKLTSKWVKDWNERTDSENPESETRKEIREFVLTSLEEKQTDTEHRKVIPFRWIAASAAAVIGAVFLFRTLLPGVNTDRLYAKYYEPMNIVSPVTRSTDVNAAVNYYQAVEAYKSHNYRDAVAGFTIASEGNKPGGTAYFCLGLCQAALENYTEAASILEKVVSIQGEFVKDAQWYLGLVYLKTGDRDKAGKCFEALSAGPGFYSDRSAKILRRLR